MSDLVTISSKIGIGTGAGRKLVGQCYGTLTSDHSPHQLIHSSLNCHKMYNASTALRFPVYEEDGVLHATHEHYSRIVHWCKECPEVRDESWRKMAACVDTGADFFTKSKTARRELIENYCNNCPVDLACLEYGASSPNNVEAVWGGLYLVKDKQVRDKAVEERRQELCLVEQ